jgi:hypothetical protein
MTNKTIEHEMSSILQEELSDLGLKKTDEIVETLLEIEKEATNSTDRRRPQKLLNQLIDQVLQRELGEE